MFIKKLVLKNFRNYVDQEFDFGDGLNIITGRNAQGKTNAAEAVFLLATGYSPKVKNEKQVIRYGEDECVIYAEAHSKWGVISSRIQYFKDQGKKITVNGQESSKVSELLGNLFAVFFNPNELKLIKEAPEDRRRFLDISISQIDRQYFSALSKYKKILVQRNTLLKDIDKQLVFDTLPVWDEQLSLYAAEIISARNNYVKKLAPLAKEAHLKLTDNQEAVEVKTESGFEGDKESIAKTFQESLYANMEKDIALGYTSIGPHRDDLKITVNGEDVKNYGSQGQQRTAALSLKLAELKIYSQHFSEPPVLILDDALSELDISRRKRLIDATNGIQTIITCTHFDEQIAGRDYKIFNIEGGKIV